MIFAAAIGRICRVTSGALIRQARTRSLSQVELSQRSGKDRAQIARWERDVVQPSLETLRELLRACGWDVELALVPYEPDPKHDARLRVRLDRTPQERLTGMLRERNR
jgi:transcriptional regulator with XRE-family HTH domain